MLFPLGYMLPSFARDVPAKRLQALFMLIMIILTKSPRRPTTLEIFHLPSMPYNTILPGNTFCLCGTTAVGSESEFSLQEPTFENYSLAVDGVL